MNWLEVGCPHCPSKLTFPQSAAGRTVACPECERSYLVPTPSQRAPGSGAWSAEPKPRPAEKPVSRTSPGDEPTVAYEPDVLHTDDPTVADRPASESPPQRESVQSNFRPPGPKRQLLQPNNIASSDDPKLAADSPLAELPLLAPPGRSYGSTTAPKPSEVEQSGLRPPGIPQRSVPQEANDPSATLGPSLPPRQSQQDAARDLTAEAQLRMRRAELRTRVNLAIFAGGTLVMVIFAWIVIRFSRPH